MNQNVFITGSAGFIGSAFVRRVLASNAKVVMYDALTYAGHLANLQTLIRAGTCDFIRGDIRDQALLTKVLADHKIDAIVNFAAESHVDNSISGPRPFVETNVVGTFELLEAARAHAPTVKDFRFLHVSTDEVFGELRENERFTEESPYRPNSPYSATKAASDHLVRAWHRTYGLNTVITNCSNNYGPRQYPEKLIPRMITQALKGEPLPVYGQGQNVRDWIHVEDHVEGVWLALTKGKPGDTYCFGGRSERRNLDVVTKVCETLDRLKPRANAKSYKELITFVEDRLGHDWRYAIDDAKAERELGFIRKYPQFEDGLEQTVRWYLDNADWVRSVGEKTR